MTVATLDETLPHIRDFDSEREDARAIQRAILPQRALAAANFEIAHEFKPLARVAGDFLDYFWLPDGTVGLYVADVVGKGISAALYAALVIGTLRGVHKTGTPPPDVLALANHRLKIHDIPGRYCAAHYAIFDPATLMLRYSTAGLPLPLHVTANDFCSVGEGGFPLGMFPESSYQEFAVRLQPGDAVVLATDGIYECPNVHQEQFGADRLGRICRESARKPARQILNDVFDDLTYFSRGAHRHDDMTALVLKIL